MIDPETLASQLTIDITTRGRRSRRPARIEIWWFRFEDRFIITGTPGPRDWFANIKADPRMTVHATGVDLAATATVIEDDGFRRRFFSAPEHSWYKDQAGLERLVADAPMIELVLTERG